MPSSANLMRAHDHSLTLDSSDGSSHPAALDSPPLLAAPQREGRGLGKEMQLGLGGLCGGVHSLEHWKENLVCLLLFPSHPALCKATRRESTCKQ